MLFCEKCDDMLKKFLVLLLLLHSLSANSNGSLHDSPVRMIDTHGHVYKSSSELNPPVQGFGKYGAHNLFDDNVKTAWAEGVNGNGINESIKFIIQKKLKKIQIVNGYAKSNSTFFKNNRIKKIKITAFEVEMPKNGAVTELFVPIKFRSKIIDFSVVLKDSVEPQTIYLPAKWNAGLALNKNYAIELKIMSVYRGNKYKDTCLSELKLIYSTNNKKDVKIRNNDSEIWIESNLKSKLIVKSKESIFQLIEIDKESRWAIIIEMPKDGVGRVETKYLLMSINQEKIIDAQILGEDIQELYGFKYVNGKSYLQCHSSKQKTDKLIDLSGLVL